PLTAYQDRWVMPMQTDPFAVPDGEKIDLLLAINAAAKTAGANYSTAWVGMAREEKFFASSVGSRLEQMRGRINPGFDVSAVNTQTGRFAGRGSLAAPRGAGWEYVLGLDLPKEATEAAPQAREKLRARRVVPGQYDLVLDGSHLWLTLHESIGHSTELDRALG